MYAWKSLHYTGRFANQLLENILCLKEKRGKEGCFYEWQKNEWKKIILTSSDSRSNSVSSTCTTASAPHGIGAPVVTLITWPGITVRVGYMHRQIHRCTGTCKHMHNYRDTVHQLTFKIVCVYVFKQALYMCLPVPQPGTPQWEIDLLGHQQLTNKERSFQNINFERCKNSLSKTEALTSDSIPIFDWGWKRRKIIFGIDILS